MLFNAIPKDMTDSKPCAYIKNRQQVGKSVLLVDVYVFYIHYQVLQRSLGMDAAKLDKLSYSSGLYPVSYQ